MKKSFLYSLIILNVLFWSSCNNDDNPEDKVKYSLMIENKTSQNLEIHLDSELNHPAHGNLGTFMAGQAKQITDLMVGINYTLRAITPGGDLANPFYEKNII